MKNKKESKKRRSTVKYEKTRVASKSTEEPKLHCEEKYLAVLKELPDIVYKIDTDGYFTFINNAIHMLGYEPKELIGKHFSKIIHPDDVKSFSRCIVLPKYKGKVTGDKKAPKLFDERRTGKRKTKDLEIRLLPKRRKKNVDGIVGAVIAFGDVSSTGHYYPDAHKKNKKFLGTLGIIRNISEHKYAEKKLYYQAYLLKDVSDAIISTDLNFNILTWNKAARKMYGWKAYQVMGKPMYKVTKSRYLSDTLEKVGEQLFKNGYWQGEVVQKRKDGSTINVLSSLSVIKDSAGNQISLAIINHDISKRKQMEENLRESEKRLLQIIQGSAMPTFVVNKKHIITHWNKACENLTGILASEVIGTKKQWSAFYSAERPVMADLVVDEIVEKKMDYYYKGKYKKSVLMEETYEAEDFFPNLGESGKWLFFTAAPLRNREGKIIGAIETLQDISARKKTQEELICLSNAVKMSTDSIVISDLDAKIIALNEATLKMYGADNKEDLIGKKSFDFIAPEDRERALQGVKIVLDKGYIKDREYNIITKNGSRIPVEMNVAIMKDSDSKSIGFVAVTRDITERRKVERQIKNSLREKEVLLKEIHHRVKNNMQIISSMLNLQSGFTKEKHILEIFRETQSRVKTMVLIHEKLYESENVANIIVSDYIKSLMHYLFHSFGVRSEAITLKINISNDISLDIDTAIPLGLIINEIVSNSLKYAFPNNRKGQIYLELNFDKNKVFTLTVKDNGIGFPKDLDFRDTKSLGLQLVCTLTEQLGGTIDLDRHGGTAFKIMFISPKFKHR